MSDFIEADYVTFPDERIIDAGTRGNWVQLRRQGIGGSDAPVVLGQSEYKSQFALWAEKTGNVEPDDLSGREEIEFGHKLEGIVLSTLAERTGRAVIPWPQTRIVQHEAHDWMRCTPDAFQVDEHRGLGIVQAKTTSAYLLKSWKDEPPLQAQIQIQHEMAVTGTTWGTLCCLVGGQRFRWFDIDRNDRFIEAMIDQERYFWELVMSETPPDIDGSESATVALQKLYPLDNGESVQLADEFLPLDEELQALKDDEKRLKERRDEIENRIKAAIGENTFGVTPNGFSYSYRRQERSEYTVKAATYRVLRRSKK